MKRVAVVVLLLAVLGVVACGGDEPEPAVEVPEWAKVAPEQIAEAKKHGVPVVFENDLGMRFVLIPAGTFLMGLGLDRVAARSGLYDVGEVQREVTLTRPFYMQITEVTNQAFRRFRASHDSREWRDPNKPAGAAPTLNRDRQPTTGVSWHDASAFAAWLSHKDAARTYRLPTEAEWEYSCRSGKRVAKTAVLVSGPDMKVLGDTRPAEPRAPRPDGTADVGGYEPNAWGLYDTLGNVHEWCSDWFDMPIRREPVVVVDPKGPERGEDKVVRGGTPTARRFARPDRSKGDFWSMTGFRLVSPLPEPKGGK